MQPDPNTAKILDDIIISLNYINNRKKYIESISEISTGINIESRNYDLCLGFDIVIDPTVNNAGFDVVLGQGIYRLNNANTTDFYPDISEKVNIYNNLYQYIEDINNYPDNFTAEIGVDLQTLIGNKILKNCYLFAEIFTYYDYDAVTIDSSIVSGYTGEFLIINKDIELDDIKKIILSDRLITNLSVDQIILYKVIIDIDQYFGYKNINNRINIIPIDLKVNRAYLGILEDNFFQYVLSKIIKFKKNILSDILNHPKNKDINYIVKQLVSNWIKCSWDNGFLNFWNDPKTMNILPDNIKTYIKDNFTGFDSLR